MCLTAECIQRELTTRVVGWSVIYRHEVGSTNDELKQLAEAGAPEGILLVADHQIAGRGRFHRRWVAPPGSSLLLSLLFRPALPPDRVSQLTMLCSLAVVDAIARCRPHAANGRDTGWLARLKWPNDVLLNGRKVAGLLTELSFQGSEVDYVVVGMGINVNLDPSELPSDLLAPATSLLAEAGQRLDRLALLVDLLEGIDQRYAALRAGHRFTSEWARQLVTLGRRVSVSERETMWEGVAEAVDDDGALRVRLPDGTVRCVRAGDVTLRPSG
jgi:BirA family biotin operon repressor/biotin-[acetyl-CoA-carboxylase] ligase